MQAYILRSRVCLIYSRLCNVNGNKCKQAVCSRETLPSRVCAGGHSCVPISGSEVFDCATAKDGGDAVPQLHDSQRAPCELCAFGKMPSLK